MSEQHYVEVIMNTNDFEESTPTGLGMMLQRVYQEYEGVTIVLRVTDDVYVKPWACDNENNFNRLNLSDYKDA